MNTDHEHEWERGAHMRDAFGVDGRRYACATCGYPKPRKVSYGDLGRFYNAGYEHGSRDRNELMAALRDVTDHLRVRIPARGAEDDYGFDDEHDAIDRAIAIIEVHGS